jgi:cytochrome c biogenesis factor
MGFKLLVIALLVSIVAALFSGLFFLHRDRGARSRTARALTLRVGLSIGLFLLLLVSFRFGLVPGYSQ